MPTQQEKRDIKYTAAPKHLVEAIRKELRRLIEEKDLDQHLGEIGRFAMQADDMLMCVKSPEAVMKSEHAITVPGAPATPIAAGAETYGANLLRQLVPLLQQYQQAQKETPEAIAYALVTARRAGMVDVSAELEKKLLGKSLEGKRPIKGDIGGSLLSPMGYLPPITSTDDYLKAVTPVPAPVASKKPSKKNGAKVTT